MHRGLGGLLKRVRIEAWRTELEGIRKRMLDSRLLIEGAKDAKVRRRKEEVHHPLRWRHGVEEPEEIRSNRI